jgi:hypothetical protein
MDLDFILHEIIQCDNEYCADLQSMYLDAAILTIKNYYPEKDALFVQCEKNQRPDHECGAIFNTNLNISQPKLASLLEKKRLTISPDPLKYYNGIHYLSPFWFEGAGEIWRRVSHGSTKVSVRDCQRIRRDSEQCYKDGKQSPDYCFRLYSQQAICESGTHCPYLRFPLMKCLSQSTNQREIDDCLLSVPNYYECKAGYVYNNTRDMSAQAKQHQDTLAKAEANHNGV